LTNCLGNLIWGLVALSDYFTKEKNLSLIVILALFHDGDTFPRHKNEEVKFSALLKLRYLCEGSVVGGHIQSE